MNDSEYLSIGDLFERTVVYEHENNLYKFRQLVKFVSASNGRMYFRVMLNPDPGTETYQRLSSLSQIRPGNEYSIEGAEFPETVYDDQTWDHLRFSTYKKHEGRWNH